VVVLATVVIVTIPEPNVIPVTIRVNATTRWTQTLSPQKKSVHRSGYSVGLSSLVQVIFK
jgi:hypothetical protein